jgi:hypothetical protein
MTLPVPVVPVVVDRLSELERASVKDAISVLDDVLGGTTPTTASGVLLVLAGIVGVSPLSRASGVSNDFLLDLVDVMDAGVLAVGIPNSFLARFLTAVVGFAMASLCRLTSSDIDTIASFGFTTGLTTSGSISIGGSSIDSLFNEAFLSLILNLFSR